MPQGQMVSKMGREAMKRMFAVFFALVAAVVFGGVDGGFKVLKASDLMPVKIELSNIAKIPIGGILTAEGGEPDIPDTPKDGIVEVAVSPEWSRGGTCGALRVSGLFVERGTRRILGGKGSCVYATVAEGAYAVTNGIVSAVSEMSGGKAKASPMKIEADGSGVMSFLWREGRFSDGETELHVRLFRNAARQMAVCTCLHTRGDGITCDLRRPTK